MRYTQIESLTIQDKSGNPVEIEGKPGETSITGPVKLQAERGFDVNLTDHSSITLSQNQETLESDPAYLEKYNIITSEGGGEIDGTYFSGPPLYLSSINNRVPEENGNMMLLGSPCGQIGLFATDDRENPTQALISAYEGLLEYTDLCPSCLDCEDYKNLDDLIELIEQFMNDKKDKILDSDYKLFQQYQATLEYWNYIIHHKALYLRAYPMTDGFFSGLIIDAGYLCPGCGSYDAVRLELSLEYVDVQESNHVWGLRSTQTNPTNFNIAVSWNESNPIAVITTMEPMDNKTSFICTFGVGVNTGVEPSPTRAYNEYRVKAEWKNIHTGVTATRYKKVYGSVVAAGGVG